MLFGGLKVLWICGSRTARILSRGGAGEQMGRNGGAREMWHLTRSTASDTLIKADPVQESLWNCIPS